MNRGLNETQLHVGGKSEPRRNVGSSRNGAASLNHAYPASLQKIIVELVSSDRAAALNFESRSDGQTLRRPLGSGAIAAAIFPSDDAAEVSAARMLRWKRILDVACIVLSRRFWLRDHVGKGMVRFTHGATSRIRFQRSIRAADTSAASSEGNIAAAIAPLPSGRRNVCPSLRRSKLSAAARSEDTVPR